jgi:hypothetical protein
MGIRAALHLRDVPATGLSVSSDDQNRNARPGEGAGACRIANVLVLLVAAGAGVLAAGARFPFELAGLRRGKDRYRQDDPDQGCQKDKRRGDTGDDSHEIQQNVPKRGG